jgi:hypothetical protein
MAPITPKILFDLITPKILFDFFCPHPNSLTALTALAAFSQNLNI